MRPAAALVQLTLKLLDVVRQAPAIKEHARVDSAKQVTRRHIARRLTALWLIARGLIWSSLIWSSLIWMTRCALRLAARSRFIWLDQLGQVKCLVQVSGLGQLRWRRE